MRSLPVTTFRLTKLLTKEFYYCYYYYYYYYYYYNDGKVYASGSGNIVKCSRLCQHSQLLVRAIIKIIAIRTCATAKPTSVKIQIKKHIFSKKSFLSQTPTPINGTDFTDFRLGLPTQTFGMALSMQTCVINTYTDTINTC